MQVKLLNKEHIRKILRTAKEYTKAEISKESNLSIATCGTILNEMLEAGEIKEAGQSRSDGGRPALRYMYNKDYYHIAGVYANNEDGIKRIGFIVADALGNILIKENKRVPKINYEVLENTFEKIFNGDNKIKAAGLGLPGVIRNGFVDSCVIKNLVGINIQKKLREAFHMDIIVENDMNFITYGAYSQQEDCADLAVIYFSENNCTGSGYIINGEILKGSTMFSGEISYILDYFGMSFKEQAAALSREEIFYMLGKFIIPVIAVINPARIILTGEVIEGIPVEEVISECLESIPKEHMPEIIINEDIYGYYERGLAALILKN